MASHDRFGYEWNKYKEMTPEYERQFLNWVGPIQKQDFKDKRVLDAGCGMGRNSYWPLSYGAKEVIAFDFDERSVRRSKKTLSEFQNARVLYKSIYDIKWEDEFDIAFSVGVIHHLKDPQKAVQNLFRALKKEGTLIVWVYGYKGNEKVVKYVDPIRKLITSRLPVFTVHFLTYFLSIPLWLLLKLTGGWTPYLKQISGFKFWHVHSIIFDQLIPEVAHYWRREEIEELFSHITPNEITIKEPENKQGWTIIAQK